MATKKKQIPSVKLIEVLKASNEGVDAVKALFSNTAHKITLRPLEEALDFIKASKAKAPGLDLVVAKIAEIEAEGRKGPRGLAPVAIGDEKTYKIQNYNASKNKPVRPTIMLNLGPYEVAGNPGATASVKYEKDRIIVRMS